MVTIDIVSLDLDDLAAVVDLEAKTYETPWSERVFRAELAESDRVYMKALAGDVLAGYGGLMVVGEEAHITTVVVDEDHRGSGVATRLMLCLVEEAVAAGSASLTLEVRTSNQPAQALYRRFGMAPVGVRKRYYVTEDALIMWVHDIDSEDYRERLDEIRRELP